MKSLNHEKPHPQQMQNDFRASPTRLPPAQCSRGCHMQFQVSLPKGSWPTISLQACGIGCYHKVRKHSTSSTNPMLCLTYRHMHISADLSTTTKCYWLQWGVRSRSTKRQTNEGHGHTIPPMGGIYQHHLTTIACTYATSKTPVATGWWIPSILNTNISPIPL
jgi:hypothetical protein